MTTGDRGERLPRRLFGPHPLLSHVWMDPEETALCLVSSHTSDRDASGREWLYAEGDAFVDAAEHH